LVGFLCLVACSYTTAESPCGEFSGVTTCDDACQVPSAALTLIFEGDLLDLACLSKTRVQVGCSVWMCQCVAE
jgi:hypothetical protein